MSETGATHNSQNDQATKAYRHMCVYIYTHTHTCIYTYICIYTRVQIHTRFLSCPDSAEANVDAEACFCFCQRVAAEFVRQGISFYHADGLLALSEVPGVHGAPANLDDFLNSAQSEWSLARAASSMAIAKYADGRWRFVEDAFVPFFVSRLLLSSLASHELSASSHLILKMTCLAEEVLGQCGCPPPFTTVTNLLSALMEHASSITSRLQAEVSQRRLNVTAVPKVASWSGTQLFAAFQQLLCLAAHLSQLLDPQLLREDLLSLILPVLRQSSPAQQGLHSLVILSRLAKEGLGGGAATAASLLCMAGVQLSAAPWKAADLRGANLSGARLPYADLTGANLRSCLMCGVDIRNACLRNANMEDVELGISLKLRNTPDSLGSIHVTVLLWLPASTSQLIGACSDGHLRLWLADTQDAISTVRTHCCPVTHLSVSADGRCFAAGASDGSVVVGDILVGRFQSQTCRRLAPELSANAHFHVRALCVSKLGKSFQMLAAIDCEEEGRQHQQLVVWHSESGVWLNRNQSTHAVSRTFTIMHIACHTDSAFWLFGTCSKTGSSADTPHKPTAEVVSATIQKCSDRQKPSIQPEDWSGDLQPYRMHVTSIGPRTLFEWHHHNMEKERLESEACQVFLQSVLSSSLPDFSDSSRLKFASCSKAVALLLPPCQGSKVEAKQSPSILHVWCVDRKAGPPAEQELDPNGSSMSFAQLPDDHPFQAVLVAFLETVSIVQVKLEAHLTSLVHMQRIRAQPDQVMSLSWSHGRLASSASHIFISSVSLDEVPQGRAPSASAEKMFSSVSCGKDFLLTSGSKGWGWLPWDGKYHAEASQNMQPFPLSEFEKEQKLCVSACFFLEGRCELAIFHSGQLELWLFPLDVPASTAPSPVATMSFPAEVTQLGFSGPPNEKKPEGPSKGAGFLAAARLDGGLSLWLQRSSAPGSMPDSMLQLSFQPQQDVGCSDRMSSTSFVQDFCWLWVGSSSLLLLAVAGSTVFQWALSVRTGKACFTAMVQQLKPLTIGVHCSEARAICTDASLHRAEPLLASSAGEIQLWRVQPATGEREASTEKLPPCLRTGLQLHSFTSLEFVGPGLLAAGGSDGSLSLFNAEEALEIHRLQACHFSSISWLKARPHSDPPEVFSSGTDGSIAVWQLEGLTGRERIKAEDPEVRILPIWQQDQGHFGLICNSADFMKANGLCPLKRSILAQLQGINLELYQSLRVPRKDSQVSGVQVQQADHGLRVVALAPAGSIIDFNVEKGGSKVRCGDVLSSVNGRTGKEAMSFLEALHETSQASCKELELEIVREVVPKQTPLHLEPPSCCPEMRPLLQELLASLSPSGVKLLQAQQRAAVVDLFWESPPVPVGKHQDFNVSERSQRILSTILRCAVLGAPLLIEGSASAGKTVAVEQAAHAISKPLLKFPVSPSTSVEDLIGSVGFTDSGELTFKPGVLPLAMSRGYWLLLDEANLASESVLQVLEELFNNRRLEIPGSVVSANLRLKQQLSERGTLVVDPHPGFCLFAAQNPPRDAQYRATRHELGQAFLSHFTCVVLEPATLNEQEAMVTRRLQSSALPAGQVPEEPRAEPGAVRLKTVGGVWLQGWEAPWNKQSDECRLTTQRALSQRSHVQRIHLSFGKAATSTQADRGLFCWQLEKFGEGESEMVHASMKLEPGTRNVPTMFLVIVGTQPIRSQDLQPGGNKAGMQAPDGFQTGSELVLRAQHFRLACRILAGCEASCIVLVDNHLRDEDCTAVRRKFQEAAKAEHGHQLRVPPCVLLFGSENAGRVDLDDSRHMRRVFQAVHCGGRRLWERLLRKLAARGDIKQSLVVQRVSASSPCLNASELCNLFQKAQQRLTLRDLLQLTDMVRSSAPDRRSLDLHAGLKAVLVQGLAESKSEEVLGALDELMRNKKLSKKIKSKSKGSLPDSKLPSSLTQALQALLWCSETSRAVLIEGPGMSGKRLLVKHWLQSRAIVGEKDIVEARLHPQSTEQDLFGQMVPNLQDGESRAKKAAPFTWQDGPVRRAALTGVPLLLIGVHLPSPAVLESLNGVLCAKPGDHLLLGGRPCNISRGFQVIATMAPGAQASRLSPAFLSRFLRTSTTAAVQKEEALQWAEHLLHGSWTPALLNQLEAGLSELEVKGGEGVHVEGEAVSDPKVHFGLLSQMLLAWKHLQRWYRLSHDDPAVVAEVKDDSRSFEERSLHFLLQMQACRKDRCAISTGKLGLEPPVTFSTQVLDTVAETFTYKKTGTFKGTAWECIFPLLATAVIMRTPGFSFNT